MYMYKVFVLLKQYRIVSNIILLPPFFGKSEILSKAQKGTLEPNFDFYFRVYNLIP